MNILYYCDEYPPVRNGGIGTVVKLVAEAMVQRGHRVYVAGKYWEEGESKTTEVINGVTVIRWHKGSYNTIGIRCCDFGHSVRNRQKKAHRIFCRTHQLIERTIAKYHIDVVEVPDYIDDFMHYENLGVERLRFSIPMIIRVHGSVSFLCYYLNKKSTFENKIKQDREHFSRADAICAVSEFSKQFVNDIICPNRSVDVIYNPISADLFAPSKSVEAEDQTILFFGKIAEMKGVCSLIKAFNMVAKERTQVRLKLIGNGKVEAARKLVERQFSDRVVFAGFLPHESIIEEIDKASFCVLPSYFENFSMAALEVLARKKALIYTKRASGPELIEDGCNGFLVDPDNVEQLAEKMSLLLDDAELCDRMACNGYEMCRHKFSTEVIVPQMEQYYQEVIQKCRE